MINAKELAKQLDNFLVSPTCQNARIQVKLPRGEFRSPDGYFDIKSISLLQNNLIGVRLTDEVLSWIHELSFEKCSSLELQIGS